MSYDYDVIVAGCGPAGSVCGRVLAASGLRVLAVDKSEFPRDKLCGGLLTWKSMQLLKRLTGLDEDGLIYAGIIDHVGHDYLIRYRCKALVNGRTEYPFHFVKRRVLDAFLLDRAREAGVTALLGLAVSDVDPLDGRVTLDDGSAFRAAILVGADGAGSVVRRSFPVSGRAWLRDLAQAMEVSVPLGHARGLPGAHEDVVSGRATLYAGFVRAGYGWVFPNSGSVVVGLGGLIRSNKGAFKTDFRDFLEFLGLPADLADRAKAHPIPYGNYLTRPHHGRALLCGDAAGLVEPFFGEGIFYAMRSGELAARAIAATPDDPVRAGQAYAASLSPRLLGELTASKRLRALLYTVLRLGLIAPIAGFLGVGGTRLVEMVHGKRSFKFLRPLSESDWMG
jgi:menaquinone-9 beta-reductase